MTNRIRNPRRVPAAAAIIAMVAVLLTVACGSLPIIGTGDPNPCDRSQAMRDALERAIERVCDRITDDDLADVSRLRVSGSLQRSDFAGLDNLQSLELAGSDLTELPPGVFDGLTNLQTLDLDNNNLTELPPGVFDDLISLQTLNFRHNGLTKLPPGAVENLANLQSLTLQG